VPPVAAVHQGARLPLIGRVLAGEVAVRVNPPVVAALGCGAAG
jgi:hypothetical protein